MVLLQFYCSLTDCQCKYYYNKSCGSVQELEQMKRHRQYSPKGQHCLQLYHVPIYRPHNRPR